MKQMQQRILEHLGDPDYKPAKPIVLAGQLRIKKKGLNQFREAIDALREQAKVYVTRHGLLQLTPPAGQITGTIKRTAGGFGFLIPHQRTAPDAPDIYIARRDMGDARSGDEALVEILKGQRREGDQPRGRIAKILQRRTNSFVGNYFESSGQGFVQVDGTEFHEPIWVGDPGAKGARADDKVVIEMVRFPSASQTGEGVLTEVLGSRGAVGVDTLSVIREFDLPDEFPKSVLDEARIQAQQFDETDLSNREDLTGETIATIDPREARDFDDAISLTRTDDGHWHLGVHIADVSHFVQPGSVLDKEAQHRGTSVYLPDRVLPMLPEIISNSLASLQKGRVRYTKSVMMEFTAEGVLCDVRPANTAIKVTRRFAYEEVLPVVFHPQKHRKRVGAQVVDLVCRMYELAMLLRARRLARGAIELTMPETKIELDKNGQVTGAKLVEHDASHQIIEEFMLAANVAVATLLDDRDITFLRRVHGNPDEAKLRSFAEFVKSLGFELQQYQSKAALQKLLDTVKDQPAMHAVNYALLRSFKQAEYSPESSGHYALSEENYCHFTSPIRRYPDLMVHRLLADLVAGETSYESALGLLALGKQCSFTERRAEKAERELIRVKLLSYLEEQIGLEMDAVITGVQKFGFFCAGVELPAEGLVHISTLADDYYDFDPTVHCLTGRRRGGTYRLGDQVRVAVAHVDIDRRELDFRVVDKTAGTRKQPKKQGGKKKQADKKHPSPKKTGGGKKRPPKGKTSKRSGGRKPKAKKRRR